MNQQQRNAGHVLDIPGVDGMYTETTDCLPSRRSALLSEEAEGGVQSA